MSQFLQIMRDLITPIAILLAAGTIVWAVWLGRRFRKNYAERALTTLRNARSVVDTSQDRDTFKANFSAIDEGLSAQPLIRHQWSKFKERLVFPANESSDPIRNTARPTDFFNFRTLDGPELPLRFYQSFPSYFVGSGLLLTFIGLVLALSFASASVGSPNLEVAKAALQDLLSAASFKFLTSIAGLGCSLGLSFYIRWEANLLAKALNEFCMALETRLYFVPTEEIAFQQLRQQENQTRQLQGFNTDFAFTIGKAVETALDKTMPRHLQDSMAPLVKTMENFASNVGQTSMSAMKGMADDFVHSLNASAGSEMRAIAETLQGIQTNLSSSGSDFSERMTNATEQLEKTMTGIGTELKVIAKSVEQSISGAKGALDAQLNETMQQLNKSTEMIGARLAAASKEIESVTTKAAEGFGAELNKSGELFQSNLGQTIQQLSGALQQLDVSVKKQSIMFDDVATKTNVAAITIEDTASSMKEIIEPLTALAREFGAASNGIRSAVTETSKAVLGAQTRMESLSGELRGALKGLQEAWARHEQRFDRVDESLGKALNEIAQGMDSNTQRLSGYVQQIDRDMGKAVSALAGGIEQLEEALLSAVDRMNGRGARPAQS